VPSVLLPASTEEYSRFLIERRRPGSCTEWTVECSAVGQRLPRAWQAVRNTLSNEPGVRLAGRPVVPPETVLATSDYRTVAWWPIRIAFRLGLIPLGAALALSAANLTIAGACIASALRRAFRAEATPT
jgi:hypothetical protein